MLKDDYYRPGIIYSAALIHYERIRISSKVQQKYLPKSFGHSSGRLFQQMHPHRSAAVSTTAPFCREFELEYTVSQTTDWPLQHAVSSASSTSACHSSITNVVLTNKLAKLVLFFWICLVVCDLLCRPNRIHTKIFCKPLTELTLNL